MAQNVTRLLDRIRELNLQITSLLTVKISADQDHQMRIFTPSGAFSAVSGKLLARFIDESLQAAKAELARLQEKLDTIEDLLKED